MPNTSSITKLLTIQVDNLRLRAYIGYLDWEKRKLQDVVISFSFKYNAAIATLQDDVHYAINYKDVNKTIIKIIDNQSFNLIETLAEQVYTVIAEFDPRIEEINITVEKPHALRFADNVMVKVSSKDRFNLALIAMGSNIDSEINMQKALEKLCKLGTVTKRTDFIKTKPLKFKDQDDFTNGAVLLHSNMSMLQLKWKLKEIEALMGRVRTDNKNAPRTIDLDIVCFNEIIIDEKELEELPFLKTFIKELQPNSLGLSRS
ncbi:2-amino-4-hydroxy-6-hydroxymethyldihydropteridine diphosphokinase [Sphingobacterium sp. SG20118]|uniref:2-amino-4-hydroxy-6- hydroxymethyldihydropteridine diphosphokinase n=1 Tax=unclassified Sphingobacterium TaxID=2609468 RepID=UPI000AEC1CD2|nr:2-amino-4-hydroxy-6-hydroxymethyldihydropteridine diphosphokinase [Sphingobacterium sp. ML3W]